MTQGATHLQAATPIAARTRPSTLRLPAAALIVLAMTIPASSVLAAEPTTGYNETPPPPTTTEPVHPPEVGEPARPTVSAPSKEEEPTRPQEGARPEEGTGSAANKSHRALPFTGFDVRLEFVLGFLLLATGCLLVRSQRRLSKSPARRSLEQ